MARQEVFITEMQQTLDTRAFEMAYEKTCQHIESVHDSERARHIRMRNMLLEEENDDLHTQLALNDDRIDGLEGYIEELREDLEVVAGSLESVGGDLRIKIRESETLKAELDSLHGVTLDSTKLLTEKLTLARELSSLRPEVDHLRSQALSYQSLLAEKLSLQRQVSTLQVELENEKRSTQRSIAKEGKSQIEDARIESQLENVQADLARERRERQKVEREAQKVSIESENKITTLESRLEAFRSKLKSTKDQLKETQSEFQTAQAAKIRSTAISGASMSMARSFRKRAASQVDADTMIGTPGDLPAAKKSKVGVTLPGEKSTFSMTPFLNRTASIAPESPTSVYGDIDGAENAMTLRASPPDHSTSREKSPNTVHSFNKSAASRATVQRKKLGNFGTAKEDFKTTARSTKAVQRLEQVAEEDNDEHDGHKQVQSNQIADKSAFDHTMNNDLELRKKKHKLLGGGLGKTLFDDDDGDAPKGDKGALAGVRGFATLGKGGLGGRKFGQRKALGASGGFGTISPLKKDRKASAV